MGCRGLPKVTTMAMEKNLGRGGHPSTQIPRALQGISWGIKP